MLLRLRLVLAGAVVASFALAPLAEARVVDAQPASHRPAKFKMKRLGPTPAAIRQGGRFWATGAVSNRAGAPKRRARLVFSLRARRTTPASRRLHLRGERLKPTRGGRTRRWGARVTIPRRVPAGRYYFFACVRRLKLDAPQHCKARRMRVVQRSVPPPPGAGVTPPGAGETPLSALRSLREAETDENFYFVMADRFNDGTDANDLGGYATAAEAGFNPAHKGYYHGGDLQGLREQLHYIRGLGTTAIWLTPSFKNRPVQGSGANESAGYHGYWITDFTQIDPHLGTNAELAGLISDAHALGMKVYFDIITNHTADVIQPEDGSQAYISKDAAPYRDAAGKAFDDRDFAATETFPSLDPETTFPHDPVFADADDATVKAPAWLNERTLYHNRGNTDFVGEDEDSTYGDFFGLDDLWTEHPAVVDGMKDIYKAWIRDFDIDGFRIDTVKHVNDEFWQDFAPDVLRYAREHGKSHFFMFGEVFATDPTFLSKFPTRDRLQAVLDFPFQDAAKRFAGESAPATVLRDLFLQDDWYTDADSNVYQLPTFLGNHDMGRIGRFVQVPNGDADSEEVFRRDRLAHELMYFSRGNPVIYYGDEQGFTGDGGDQDARQDMFPSLVATYNDDDLIATDATTAEENFDPSHPLYQAIARLAHVAAEHPALRTGVHQHRFAASGQGIYAFSRLDRVSQREYVVALNNAESGQTAAIPTSAARGAGFELVYGEADATAETDADGRLPVRVPALSAVVYRSTSAIPRSAAAPPVDLVALPDGGAARDRAQVRAFVAGDSFYDVTFYARTGDRWTAIGTDDSDPYRVFHDVAAIAPGTNVQYRAVVLDNGGNARMSELRSIQVAPPSIAITAPQEDGRIRNEVTVTAEAVPNHNHYSVEFFRRVGGGGWTSIGTDSSQPAYTAFDDVSGLAAGTLVRYRAVLTYGPGQTVTSGTRSATVAPPVTQATIHYFRPDGQYDDWGLHLFGAALAPGEATPAWETPTPFEGCPVACLTDGYGGFKTIDIADDTAQVGFIVHGMPPNHNTKDVDPDRFFRPIDHAEIWLKQGDPTIYFAPPPVP